MLYYEKKLLDVFSNGNGNYVDCSNLKHLLHYLGYRVDTDKLRYLLERNGILKNNISFEEIYLIREEFPKISSQETLDAFEYFNEKKDGDFNVQPLKEILQKGKDAFSQEEIDELVRNIDCDYQGNFNYEMLIAKKLTF